MEIKLLVLPNFPFPEIDLNSSFVNRYFWTASSVCTNNHDPYLILAVDIRRRCKSWCSAVLRRGRNAIPTPGNDMPSSCLLKFEHFSSISCQFWNQTENRTVSIEQLDWGMQSFMKLLKLESFLSVGLEEELMRFTRNAWEPSALTLRTMINRFLCCCSH